MMHFCVLKNQPRFRAKAGDKAGVIHFEFAGGCTIDPKTDHHVYRGPIAIVNKEKLLCEWWRGGGADKPQGRTRGWSRLSALTARKGDEAWRPLVRQEQVWQLPMCCASPIKTPRPPTATYQGSRSH